MVTAPSEPAASVLRPAGASAEASVAGTPLVGRTLGELAVREGYGVNVVGVLERGDFRS